MLASVIIPTYNGGEVVLRSLKTWVRQTLPFNDFEVIIVDNNSSDSSPELIKSFIKDYPNFSYMQEVKPGSTNARHAGAKVAKADLLIFCDNDGLFNERFIEAILQVYNQNNEVVAVTGKIDIEWDAEEPKWIEPYLFMLGKLNYGSHIIYDKNLYLNGGIFSIKKDTFEKLGGFNPDLIDGKLIGDGDTGLVYKLHDIEALIGYTPFAVMKHLQFVNKHGTINDLGRRFYNVGTSNSYTFLRKNGYCLNKTVYYHFGFKALLLVKKLIEHQFDKKNRRKYFSLMERKGEFNFFMNLFNKDFINMLKSTF